MKQLILVAMFLATMVCRADVSFRGTKDHSCVWNSLYASMPTVFKSTHKLSIIELNDMDMLKYSLNLTKQPVTSLYIIGLYDRYTYSIHVKKSYYKIQHVLLHEYGHFVWYNILTEADRQDYLALYLTDNYKVSDYAYTKVSEGFAEDFSYYNLYGDIYDTKSNTYYFIRTLKKNLELRVK